MDPSRHWSGFDQAWKSVEQLKHELHKTEQKLKNVSIPSVINGEPSQLFSTVPNISADSDNYLRERRWRKRKIYSRLKGSHLFTQQSLDPVLCREEPTVPLPNYIEEDQPRFGYRSPLHKPSEINKSSFPAFTFLKDHLEASSKESSSTSSIVLTDELRDGRGDVSSQAKPSAKIHLSRWEKDFLSNEVPEVHRLESAMKDSNETSVMKQPARNPVTVTLVERQLNAQKLAWQRNRLKDCSGFQKLKLLIEQQKDRNNRLISEIENDPFILESTYSNGYVPEDRVPKAVNVATSTRSWSPSKDNKTSPVMSRKTTTAQPPPAYKGFSPVVTVSEDTKNVSPTLPRKVVPPFTLKSPKRKVMGSPGRAKSSPGKWTYSKKSDFTPPCVIFNGGKDDLFQRLPNADDKAEQTGHDLIKTVDSASGEDSISSRLKPETNAVRTKERRPSGTNDAAARISATMEDELANGDAVPFAGDVRMPAKEGVLSSKQAEIPVANDGTGVNSTIDLTESPVHTIENLKHDDKENDLPTPDGNLLEVRKMLKQIIDENDTDSDDTEIMAMPSATSKLPSRVMIGNKKRKASKQPEQKPPEPKIRHYNQEEVRKYMLRQKVLRQRRLQEERQRIMRADQLKKERLLQVYEQQKLVAKSKPKPAQPLKLLQESNIPHFEEPEPREHIESPKKFTSPKKICFPKKVASPMKISSPKKAITPIKKIPIKVVVENQPKDMPNVNDFEKLNNESSQDVIHNENLHPNDVMKFVKENVEKNIFKVDKSVEKDSKNNIEDQRTTNEDPKPSKDSKMLSLNEYLQESITQVKNINETKGKQSRSEESLLQKMLPKVLIHIGTRSSSEPAAGGSSKVTSHDDSPESVVSTRTSSFVGSDDKASASAESAGVQDIKLIKKSKEPVDEAPYVLKLISSPLTSDSSMEEAVVEDGPLENMDVNEDIPRIDCRDRGNQGAIYENSPPVKLPKATTMTQGGSQVNESTLDGESFKSIMQLDFSSYLSIPDPYNFIHAWQKKPLVMHNIPQETESTTTASSVKSPSPFPVAKSTSDKSQSFESESANSHSVPVPNEDKAELTVCKIPTSGSSEEDSTLTDDMSTTIPSVISTDTQSRFSPQQSIDGSCDVADFVSAKESISNRILTTVESVSNMSKEKFTLTTGQLSDSVKTVSTVENSVDNGVIAEEILGTGISSLTSGGVEKAQTRKSSDKHKTSSSVSIHTRKSTKSSSSKPKSSDQETLAPRAELQLLDSHSITRVAAEAASAAATSAVIAALEYQKLLPSKKQLLQIMTCKKAPSEKAYSSDFENISDVPSHSVTSSQQSLVSVESKKNALSEQSVEEEVFSPSNSDTRQSNIQELTHTLSAHSQNISKLTDSEALQLSTSAPVDSVIEKQRKRSENISSPSPASLSDNESLKSTSINTTESSMSHVSQLSDGKDAVHQLTMEMIKQRSLEEEQRARQQLTLLACQEKALVENVRSELRWLELLKRKLQEKQAHDKLPVVLKRQEELVARLRQERAQLRCLQEMYRNVGQSHNVLLTEKKKLLADEHSTSHQSLHRKESLITEDKTSGKESPVASTSATSLISALSIDRNSIPEEVKSLNEIPEIASSTSFADVITESLSKPAATKSSRSTVGKPKSSISAPQLSSIVTEPAGSQIQQTGGSLDSVLQGMKRLESNKRYLIKKEQRLLQRRSRVETLIQWQRKLEKDEKEVKEMEKEAVQLLEKGKNKCKYFASSATASSAPSPQNNGTFTSSQKSSDATSKEVSIISSHSSVKESLVTKDDRSVPTVSDAADSSDKIATTSSLNSNKESGGSSNDDRKQSGSVAEEISGHPNESTSSMAEEIIDPFNESSSTMGEDNIASKSTQRHSSESFSVDSYSDSFTSASKDDRSQAKSRSPPKRWLNSSARAQFLTSRHRRQDSSGSDDSFTISHSETASDQSDLEGRIYALTEELKQRKAEADRLRGEHKKQHSDRLRERETSLRKQLEAYDKYIREASLELEQQLEAVSSPDSILHQTVKPQIKQPRVAKSRHLQNQGQAAAEPSVSDEKKSGNDSPKEAPIISTERKTHSTSHLAKKLRAIETKEISEEIANQSSTASNDVPKSHSSSAESEQHQAKSLNSPNGAASENTRHTSDNSFSDFVPSDEAGATPPSKESKSLEESQSSVDESIVLPSEEVSEYVQSESDDSAVNTLRKSHSSEEDSFESGSTIGENDGDDEKCAGSDGCSPKKLHGTSAALFLDESADVSQQVVPVKEDAVIRRPKNKEVFIDDIFNSILKSLLEDTQHCISKAMGKMGRDKMEYLKTFHGSKKGDVISAKLKPKVVMSLTDVHDNVATKVSDGVINFLVDDAILAISKLFRKSNLTCVFYKDRDDDDATLVKSKISQIAISTSPADNNAELNSFTGISMVSSFTQGGLKGNATSQLDWLSDDTFPAHASASLPPVDQQLMVHQYPYYYRQIPNKPPPPYTPPSSPFPSSASKDEKELSSEITDNITEIKANIDDEISKCVISICEGYLQGLRIEDIDYPNHLQMEPSSADAQNQVVFRHFLFDLTKDTILQIYVENKEEAFHYRPWLRNQTLKRKPVFIPNIEELLPVVLKKVKQVLKFKSRDNVDTQETNIWSAMKLGRKKRDFVDTIIIEELKEEETEWINYDEDEFQVKMQLTDSIFELLLKDAFQVVLPVLNKPK